MEQARRRVRQEQLGHRGRKHDPLYQIRNPLRAGADKLTPPDHPDRSRTESRQRRFEVTLAWHYYQQLRLAFTTTSLAEGKKIALAVLDSFHTCPVAEIARLGRTLRARRGQFLAYFITGRVNNGGTQGINGIIELHGGIARGFRNPRNY